MVQVCRSEASALAVLSVGLFAAATFAPTQAYASCTPAAGSNETVACAGKTVNQTPGTNSGYGDSTQNGLTLTVGSGASVIGTSNGIDVNNHNTITNLGTITTNGSGIGNVYGINGNGPLTVNNSGSIGRVEIHRNINDLAGINTSSTGLSVTNNVGGVIQGETGIQGIGAGVVVNSGLINGIVGGGGQAINFAGNSTSTVTVTNKASGTITGDAFGINASGATVTNFGTISAPSFGGVAVNANTLTLVNKVTGVIKGNGGAISGTMTPALTITNFGKISSGKNSFGTIFGDTVNVTNSGTISIAANAGGSAILMESGDIVNKAGGVIKGAFATIAAFDDTRVFNAGTISATSGDAIFFASAAGGGNTLTLAAGFAINGAVRGSGVDTLQLGGAGDDAFDVSRIGAGQQYQGFETFNKIGASTWTLTGVGAQDWTVSGGVLALGAITALGPGNTVVLHGGELLSLVSGVVSSNVVSDAHHTNVISAASGQTFTLGSNGGASFIAFATGTTTVFGSPTDNGTVVVDSAFTGVAPSARVVVAGGTLRAGPNGTLSDALGSMRSTTVDAGATLDFSPAPLAAVNNLQGAGVVVLGAKSLPPAIILNGRLTSGGFAASLFSGVIEGARGVWFGPQGLGGGMITLTGENTFTGGSTILRNQTVQLGDGGATGSLVGNVAFTSSIGPPSPTLGLLAFDRSDTYAFAGKISGLGDIAQIGSGALILTADNTYTGATTVSAGTLIVNGSIASSSLLTLDSGATLGGSGTVGGFVAPAGATVAPGALTPFSTLHVAGGVTFLAGSTYVVNVNAAGQSDALIATGKARLSGGTVDVLPAAGTFTVASRYTILTADGGVSGRFASLVLDPDFAFIAPALSYDADHVFLGFTQTATFPSVAITPNETATATALQAQSATSPLYEAVLGQTVAGARAAFDALSGEIHPSAVSGAFEDSRLPREAILDRLASPFGAAGGGATGFAAMNAIVGPSVPANVFTAWGQAFGSYGHIGGDGNAATLDRSLGGFILGVDGAFDNRYRLGVAAGYTQSTISVDARSSSGNIDSTFGGVYGGASFNALQLRAGALYAYNRYGTDRSVDFPGFADTASAGYGGDTLQAFGEAGWRVPVSGFAGPTSIEPFVGALAMQINTGGFSEAGGASALTGASSGYDYGATTLGVRGEATLFANVPLLARGMVGWQHVFGDVTPTSTLAFESAPTTPFSIAGAPVARDALLIEAGFDWRLSANATVGVFYSGALGARDEDNAIKGKLEIAF